MIRLYTKEELMQLCGAYDVYIKAKWNKSQLVKELTPKLIECTEMPCHGVMSNYAAERYFAERCSKSTARNTISKVIS